MRLLEEEEGEEEEEEKETKEEKKEEEEEKEETGKEDDKFGNLAEVDLSEEGEEKALQKVDQVVHEVEDLEEQGWITHKEAHKELKELEAIRDDIHQEFSEEKNGAGAPNEEKDNVPSPIYSSSLYTAVCEVPVLR